jgi:hypothetical protein
MIKIPQIISKSSECADYNINFDYCSTMFSHPVGVQLFNRPEYAQRVLSALSSQTMPLDQRKLYIFIDGFPGSIYAARKQENLTSEVEEIAFGIFPYANIRKFHLNRGIADLHNLLQQEAFSVSNHWAAFFEEDIVVDTSYLQELSDLIQIVDKNENIVKVACFQILDSLAHLPRGYNGFYPGTGTKAFAERKQFFEEKQLIVNRYIELVKDQLDSKEQFVNIRKGALLASEGHLLAFFQKDSLVESFLHFQKKLHVVTMPNLATDIGIHGIHDFVTSKLNVELSENEYKVDIEKRKNELNSSLDDIRRESVEHIVLNYKDILEGFYISRSRKAMIARILKNSIKKLSN